MLRMRLLWQILLSYCRGTGGSLKTPVLYPAGMVEDKEASDDDKAAAEAFLEYLQSDEALEVFEKYGFAAYVNGEKTDDMAALTMPLKRQREHLRTLQNKG